MATTFIDLKEESLRYHFQFSSSPKILLHNIIVFNEQHDLTKLTCGNKYTISLTLLFCDIE